jgi:hypothetical protein
VRGERGEAGLVQLLLAMAMALAVLGGTLTIFTGSEKVNRENNQRNESQEGARRALDMVSRDLRNLASPTPEQPEAVDLAGPYDIVFESVDPVGPNLADNGSNVERVRYCLGGTAEAGVLYRQEQRWTTSSPPGVPSTTACPSSVPAWSTSTPVAWGITNARNGLDRPLFRYDSEEETDISLIHTQLFIDEDPLHGPAETSLSTGVFLRNQNRRPEAAFTAETAVPGSIVLNGSTSQDPEGEPLLYAWYDAGVLKGTGIRFDYQVTTGTTHNLVLKVYDPAGLEGISEAEQVTARGGCGARRAAGRWSRRSR